MKRLEVSGAVRHIYIYVIRRQKVNGIATYCASPIWLWTDSINPNPKAHNFLVDYLPPAKCFVIAEWLEKPLWQETFQYYPKPHVQTTAQNYSVVSISKFFSYK
jgi:hypothetical protein